MVPWERGNTLPFRNTCAVTCIQKNKQYTATKNMHTITVNLTLCVRHTIGNGTENSSSLKTQEVVYYSIQITVHTEANQSS